MRKHLLALTVGLALVPQLRAQQDRPRTTLDTDIMSNQVAFTADGKRLIVAGQGGLQVWDAGTAKLRATPLETEVTAFAIRPDGRIVATGNSHDMTIELIDLTTGRRTARWEMPRDNDSEGNSALAFSPDGKTLAVGVKEAGKTFLWNVPPASNGR